MYRKLVVICLAPLALFSQEEEDLFGELDKLTIKAESEVNATFKSSRLMLGQSTERVKANQLHMRISHVFGKIKGIDNFFGMDHINNMHMSFEYGLKDHIQLGLARSNKPDKTYSGSVKLSLYRQRQGDKPFPISLSYFLGIDYKSRKYTPKERDEYFNGRLDYVNQVLVSRKFNEKLSLLLSPTWIHRNLTDNSDEPNNVYTIGIGGRYLFSRSMSVNIEYFYALPTFDSYDIKKNSFSIGLDIETGGHVFQLFFTDAFALHPGKFAINQSGDFFKRDINFGFSILREFSL
ncbi:MAG: hypothetical protein COA88_08545 [Kordia sp.]|nr:MAG: hypothetical protein COA88_08545 [Kordia sp.]